MARKAAPAPEPEDISTLHDELLASVQEHTEFPDREPDESANDYLARIHKAVGEIPSEAWDVLSDEAQTWYNDSLELVAAEKAALPLDGVEPDPAPPAKGKRRPAVAKPDPEPEPDDEILDEDPEEDPEEAPKATARAKTTARATPAAPAKAAPAKTTARAAPAAPAKTTARATPAAPAKATARAAPAAPARKQVAPAQPSSDSAIGALRSFLIDDPKATFEEMITYLSGEGFEMNQSTARTARYWVTSTINAVKEAGHWKN
jgi:hypothetical protein